VVYYKLSDKHGAVVRGVRSCTGSRDPLWQQQQCSNATDQRGQLHSFGTHQGKSSWLQLL
jgi:hypothetical protein